MVFYADKQQLSVIPPNEDNIFEDYMNEIVKEEEKMQATTDERLIESDDDEPKIPVFP